MVLLFFSIIEANLRKMNMEKHILLILGLAAKAKWVLVDTAPTIELARKKRVSRAGDGVLAVANFSKDCFGETPEPTRETRALPEICAVLAATAFDNAASV
ncbi:MAG TPA: hypothetical protein VEX43_16185 [Chthoniobacterales bacterium]|nr:hypothetical protein [Chthoniobacterales bacterium]